MGNHSEIVLTGAQARYTRGQVFHDPLEKSRGEAALPDGRLFLLRKTETRQPKLTRGQKCGDRIQLIVVLAVLASH